MNRSALCAGLAIAAAVAIAPTQAHAQDYPPPPPGFEPHAQPGSTYVPPSVAMSGPRVIKDWEEGEPIPPGYHPVSRIRKGLVIGGAVTFGAMYLINVIAAAATHDAGGNADPLYAPVVGPFIMMGRVGGGTGSATAKVFLAIDGIAQAAGVTMLVLGIALPKVVLVRNDLAKVEMMPSPLAMPNGGAGAGFVGTF